MDKIINKINDDIREIQLNPCYEVSLIGCSIYAHFRSVVKLYEDCNKLDDDHIYWLINGDINSPIPLVLKRDILELGAKIKVMRQYLNKESK
jgi:hypothetical protein